MWHQIFEHRSRSKIASTPPSPRSLPSRTDQLCERIECVETKSIRRRTQRVASHPEPIEEPDVHGVERVLERIGVREELTQPIACMQR
jgi:hypothetical protein